MGIPAKDCFLTTVKCLFLQKNVGKKQQKQLTINDLVCSSVYTAKTVQWLSPSNNNLRMTRRLEELLNIVQGTTPMFLLFRSYTINQGGKVSLSPMWLSVQFGPQNPRPAAWSFWSAFSPQLGFQSWLSPHFSSDLDSFLSVTSSHQFYT